MPTSRTRQRAAQPRQAPPEERAVVVFDAKKKATDLTKALEERRDQIGAFLQVRSPEEQDRFMNIAVDSIVRDQNLLSADLLSLVQSVRHAAIMGLEPTSIMGEGAIVVYRDSSQNKKIAQFQPMVRGLQKLARNSGEIAAIGVDVVRRKDHFVYRSGSDPVIEHEPFIPNFMPDPSPSEGNDVIGAYAYLKLRSGELVPLFMSTEQIHQRRQISKSWRNSGEQSVWGQWPEEMMKKTVLRRLLMERAPLSFRAQTALALDAEIDSADGDPTKVEARLSRTATRALAAHVDDSGQDDAGAAQDGDTGADTAPTENGAPDGPTAGTDDAVEGEARDLDQPECSTDGCIREKHEASVTHRNADGETWFDE